MDEIYQFIAPKILNDNSGLSCFSGDSVSLISNSINLEIYESKMFYPDILIKSIVKKQTSGVVDIMTDKSYNERVIAVALCRGKQRKQRRKEGTYEMSVLWS